MPTALGSLRRLLLTPQLAEVTFGKRGFPVTPSAATAHLEAIPESVICGFEWGIDTHNQWEVESRVALVAPELRGFAYEGVTMAFTVLDAMKGGRGTRTRELLRGPAAPHIFLAFIGIGFAMARLPRPLWKKVIPDLTGSPYYPTMSWLAVDGYGFDRAFFDTERWVDQQRIPAAYPWEGSKDYFLRAVDQGIGRALWFIHGANTTAVASAVGAFAERRQADLWSGVGLAATFAGGCAANDLGVLRREAGPYRADLAQGAVFAGRARAYSGHVPPHTEVATAVLADLVMGAAITLADDNAVRTGDAGPLPDYELWRQRVRSHFSESADRISM